MNMTMRDRHGHFSRNAPGGGPTGDRLSDWISLVESSRKLDTLVGLEVWLRSLSAILTPGLLPMTDADQEDIATRDFTVEAAIVRRIVLLAEAHVGQLATVGEFPGSPDGAEIKAEPGSRAAAPGLDALNRLVGPSESLQRLLEVLSDIRVFIDSVPAGEGFGYRQYLAVGRLYRHSLKSSRHVSLLLNRRFKSQYDRVESAVVSDVLRRIDDETRQRVALVLLHLFQILKHLQVVAKGLTEEGPIRHYLALFALVHDDADQLRSYIRARFAGRRALWPDPQYALEWIYDYLGIVMRTATRHELAAVTRETSPASIALTMSRTHDTLRFAVQGCIASLTNSFEPAVSWEDLFGGVPESASAAVRLHRELWEIRHMVFGFLTGGAVIEIDRLLARLNQFRESYIQRFSETDWQELEKFSGGLLQSRSLTDQRRLLGEFASFLETLAEAGVRWTGRSPVAARTGVT